VVTRGSINLLLFGALVFLGAAATAVVQAI